MFLLPWGNRWRGINNLVFWTTDLTAVAAMKPCIRGDRADCTFWGYFWSYSICSKMLHVFYVFFFPAIICRDSPFRANYLKKLSELIEKACSVQETPPLCMILQLIFWRTLRKVVSVLFRKLLNNNRMASVKTYSALQIQFSSVELNWTLLKWLMHYRPYRSFILFITQKWVFNMFWIILLDLILLGQQLHVFSTCW